MVEVTITKSTVGRISGTVILTNVLIRLAPSRAADS